MTNLKLLITGASGNLGSYLKGESDRMGHSYECLTRSNLDDLDQLTHGCDVVVHAAGDHINAVTEKLVGVTESNLLLTTRVLEACVKNKVSRFFYISSCAVYGNATAALESDECYPVSLNGKFKKLNEDLIATYCAAHNICFTSFRLFNIYGGNDRFSILYHLVRCCSSGQRFKFLNNGASSRDFIHVGEAAELICRCLSIDELPNVLNVGTGRATSVSEIVAAFQKICPALLTENSTAQEVRYSCADTSLLKQIVGNYQCRDVLDEVVNLRFKS